MCTDIYPIIRGVGQAIEDCIYTRRQGMILLFVMMCFLFVLGIPIAWSMAISSLIYMHFVIGVPLQTVTHRMIGGLDNFTLLAIPFFIFAGDLMNTGGITKRLVDFAKVLVGHITGGLGHVVVVTNMIMAGMSGSGVADAAGSGAVLIPAMEKAGFPRRFAAALTSSAATIGPIIPPSIPFVIYGSMANVSIGRLLLAGAVPGCLLGIMLMVAVYILSKKRGYPKEAKSSLNTILKATLKAIPPMGMPAIVLIGIIAGIMTPTEAAAAGSAYALILGVFIYRELKLRDIWEIVLKSVKGTAAITIIMAAASPMAWVIAFEQTPLKIIEYFSVANFSTGTLLLIINISMLILGCFLESIAMMVMAIPILMPLVLKAGVDPVHFGVILVFNVVIGAITPPVGTIMYVVCSLARVSILDFTKEVWPFIIVLLICLGFVTQIPEISTWLPNSLMIK
jgi:C4-dicarboxylate transporter DctM subunit